ncbi:uncharacterized protein YqgV (UPF0045/DUF77 family) [Breznakia sp. PF5-3]|uniref:YkoF family thiamine/hydroxymethylpyrimidine-binding protein n=1 Tax=unclassified Breznakia TaxID=2623764 RepID=UPI002406485C|nr:MULTISPECIES: YkoF family thiamine/hydroxymethylpyrimidine-binding protein [unclassified Breznakia]MDF9825887.1 uncharacterized protein YqgV (UPF0045/DUF77 family) [Breznakia sp. PM6-1]MDF9836680.1 uncharacterized protein YqgV (UPF0045/DUF77 family) [Breznakia sp. PF5-3]MDF9838960.1 uncharacterized protein YqgV (UPF0045/DUF77 family) [Breznakia sp. PFB2-8]MDF9860975.1 uncharacterized protein YqgV (UPF0045/DUF77 family) [Breznakia sp. PH5-24]
MRKVSNESFISCQISFYPLGKKAYTSDIDKVLSLIQHSELSSEITDMATVIKGTSEEVYALLQKITTLMKDTSFVMNVTISNTCGCIL